MESRPQPYKNYRTPQVTYGFFRPLLPRDPPRRPTSCPRPSRLGPVESRTQYTSLAFGRRCREAGVVPSMGSAGHAYDNALAEAFFATLETELLQRQAFLSRGAARGALFDYIEG
jgi:transposase InsO family protein